jgi:hypothetical protein
MAENIDEGRRQVMLENESLDVAVGVRDVTGAFVPLRLGPGSGELTLGMVLKLVDPSGDEVYALSDEQRLLRTRPYEPFKEIVVTDIGAAWTVCAENVTANSIMRVWVELWKYHTGTAAAGVDVRFDDGGGTHEIVHNMFVSPQSPGPKLGPYHLTNGWSIDMRTNVAARCRCVATIEQYGMDAL